MASWSSVSATPESQGPSRQVVPDPKPVARLRATRSDWDGIREQFDGECCVATGQREVELHHVVRRSQGGDDVAENLVPLAHTAHQTYHAHSPGWRRIAAAVRAYVEAKPERLNYVVGKIGLGRFNELYPENTRCELDAPRNGSRAGCVLAVDHSGPCRTLSDDEYLPRDYDRDAVEGHDRWQGPF